MIVRSLARAAAFTACAALLGACASGPTENPNDPQACVVVDNSDAGGPASQVYLVRGNFSNPASGATEAERSQLSRGERWRIGEVSMGREERFCFRRPTVAGEYYIIAEITSADRLDPATGTAGSFSGAGRYNNNPGSLVSDTFTLDEGWVVSWNTKLNQIRLLSTGSGGGGS